MKLTAIATAFLLASLPARAEWVEITLPTGENVKAVYEKPKMVGKVHAVIYLHGRMLREAGYGDAADRGSDIAAFAGAFAHAGFVSIAPLRKTPLGSDNGDDVIDEGLASILGATKFLHQHHDILRISVVGFRGRRSDSALGVVTDAGSGQGHRSFAVQSLPGRHPGGNEEPEYVPQPKSRIINSGTGPADRRRSGIPAVQTHRKSGFRSADESTSVVPVYPQLSRQAALVSPAAQCPYGRRNSVSETI